MWLVALPEVAYCKSTEDVLARWFPPKGTWFKFAIEEFEDGTSFEEMKSKLLISDQLVYLTKEEIKYYKEKYPPD
jgi:hypothetical protein